MQKQTFDISYESILKIINSIDLKPDAVQLYHYSNEGVCSWYDFAKQIFELTGLSCEALPIETKDYPTAAKRPHYSLLNKAKIKHDYQLEIPYWKDSLRQCLKKSQETQHI